MSDGPCKPDEEVSLTEGGIQRAGRARICKQCKFTTRDVRAFSNHRLHAHAEENSEDNCKTVTRKNSLRRKSSAACEKIASMEEQMEVTSEDRSASAANAVDTYPKSENITKLEQTTDMTSDQISPELLSSLALAPRKSFGSEKSKNNTMDKFNRHFEEALTDSRDDEHDDEDRLVIADGSDNEADSPDDHVPSRSGNIQNRNYLCENCDFTSNSAKAYLRHHVDVHNSGIVIYECDICDYATKYKQKLPRHRKLHFSGKDGPDESDLENKFAEGELKGTAENNGMTSINMELMNGEEDMDDGIEADEEDEEEMVALSAHDGHNLTAGSTPMEAKKKRIRQEVDPLKYYEVMDEVGVKYACSKCGNVYKWRKSLNKHWKEKHCGEIPDLTKPPATLQNYTLYCRYKTKFGGPPPAAPNVVYGAATASPANQMKAHRATPTSNHSESGRVKDEPQIHQTPTLSNVVMPRQIGPFIAGTTVNSGPLFSPVNRSNHTNHMTPRSRAADSHHEMRHVVNSMQVQSGGNQSQKQFMPHEVFQQQKLLPKPMQQNQQSEPLDFSKKSSEASGKSEPSWPDTNSESDSLTEMPISLMVSQANSQIAAAMKHGQEMNDSIEASTLRCGKCNYIAKTLADYSSHMALHLNKRAFKCAECGSHFTGIDELNKHFMDYHSEKIQEHKEAIQKIPHGLQQTYHLLKMPLDSISGLSSQELMSNEPKQLKCSMCSFVAKWPAELQKHAVSHSEERPFVCMVCGSTYKWKWDLVKHFEKSHSTLPNPYKRREGGGVMASNSPATPPPDMIAMGKSQANLMDMSAMSSNYNDEEVYSAGNKRRLSESESWDAEHYLREYLERQARDRKEMGQLELHSHLLMQARGAFSDPVKRVKVENHDIEDYDNQTPKRIVHEALKERLNSGNIKHEELTPSKDKLSDKKDAKGEVVLPYKCTVCEYRARWPSEISQHMKNHSTEKPYHCPRCSYKSKWKWDVVKHLRRCGGGTVHDVIDTTKMKKMAPPNIMVLPMGNSGQQNGSQTLNQPKASLSQSVFPGGQRYSSLSPAMNLPMSTVSKSLANNFNILSGNKDHQEAMDVSSDPAKQPVFRSLVNQGFHHCLECQFIGNSPTELKRHSLLHSENKPFNCNDCGYSTRWKCDLKKHIKNYGHQNTSITLDDDEDGGDEENENDNSMEQFTELSEDSDEDQSTLYMCPQCPYNSYKKKAYDLHLKIHGGWSNAVDEVSETSSPLKESKYKCSKCDYHGNDLSSFLHHKRSHNFEEVSNGRSQDSPVPSEVSSRTLHLKHRRKPVKQFKCDRCPYVCFKKSALHVHDAMHIPRGTDTFLCMFCDYNVFSKTLLLQHMRLHPDYNPAECSEADSKITSVELEEIERLEEAEINSDDSRSLEENNNDGEASDRVLDFSCPNSSRTTTPVNGPVEQSVKQQVSPTNNNSLIGNMNNNEKTSPSSGMNLPCEWCSATFPNVVALYHHSRSLHPNQLKAQEAGDIAARQAPSKGMQLEQIVRERQKEYQVYHHQVTSLSPSIVLPFQHAPSTSNAQSLLNKLVPLAPKPSSFQQSPGQQTSPQSLQLDQSERARKSITQQKKSRSFQCTKCTFTAPNAVTYLRHIERHGSNCKHTCLFCDYSIDRLNLLYQHMKGTHGAQWAGSPEEKISHVVLGEDSNNNLIDEMNDEQAEDMIGESLDMDVEGNDAERGVLFAYQEKGIVPKLVLLEESVWRGIPLSICSLEGKRHFKCPKCMYINANAANTANHFQQHGQNRRFRCHQCDYSVDNPKTMQHHLESIHPKEPNYTLVKSAKKPEAVAAPALHSCPKCPYKTTEKVKLAIHMERHSGTGRFDCQLCDYKVDQYGHLRQHARLHKKAITSLVSADEAMFTTERSFEDQEFAKRWNDNNPVDQLNRSDSRVCFKCSQCPFFTFKKEKILKHRLCHISKGPYACQDCSFSTNFTNDLEEHVQYHSTLQAPSDQALEFVLDPFSELYKVLEKFPDDLKADNCMENLEEDYTMDIDNDMEDDEEAALMEEELRDTVGGALDMDVRDRNGEVGFDSEIQFRNYKCQDCPYSSNSNAEYSKHLKLHGCDKKFKCDFCSYSLDRVNLISQHRKLHFQEKSFESTPLIAKLLNKNHEEYESLLAKIGNEIAHPPAETGAKVCDEFLEMYLSQNVGDDKGRYLCNKCPYRCQALKSFRCHIQWHGINRKYRCDYCDWSADRLNLLIQHRRVHSGEKGFIAAPGEIEFLNRDFVLDGDSNDVTVGMALVEYQDIPLSPYDPKTSPKKNAFGQKIYYCKMCPFKSENTNTFSFHKKLHCIQAKYSCSECSYSINNITSLKEHIKLHKKEREQILASLTEGGTKHKCPKCPYSSTNKNMLVNHMSMHGAGRKHECKDCDFGTDTQALLTLHIKVHKDGYSESDVIEEMELLVKRSPDVIGPQLYMSTANSLDLDSDFSDGSDSDHKCEKCPYSTPSKDELGSHNQHHEMKDKHTCMYCTFSCFDEDELVQHVQVHFPSTSVDKEMLRSLKRQYHKRNLSKALNDGNFTTSKDGEPDSTTVTDAAKSEVEAVDKTLNDHADTKQVEKTKVYVCQYCEREYDDKANMIQHEKQHLVGSKF